MSRRPASNASARCAGGRRDDDGQVAHREVAHAMHGGQRDDVALVGDAGGHVPQPVDGRGMRAVRQLVDRLLLVDLADRPDEQRDAARRRIAHGGEHLVEAQRGVADVEQPELSGR